MILLAIAALVQSAQSADDALNQAADAPPPSYVEALKKYEDCIVVKSALLEPSDSSADDIMKAAEHYCDQQGIGPLEHVMAYYIDHPNELGGEEVDAKSIRIFDAYKARAEDKARFFIVGIRANRKAKN